MALLIFRLKEKHWMYFDMYLRGSGLSHAQSAEEPACNAKIML